MGNDGGVAKQCSAAAASDFCAAMVAAVGLPEGAEAESKEALQVRLDKELQKAYSAGVIMTQSNLDYLACEQSCEALCAQAFGKENCECPVTEILNKRDNICVDRNSNVGQTILRLRR